jgi:secreted trypsin-like serine protease
MSHEALGRDANSDLARIQGRALLCAAALVVLFAGCSGADRAPATSADRAAVSEKIYQGFSASISDVPWTGRIAYVTGNGNHCTAALIAPGWAITAAHCLFDPDYPTVPLDPGAFNISFGMRDLKNPGPYAQTSAILEWLPHPSFSHGRDYDVGLIRLATPMTTNAAVTVIALQPAPDQLSYAMVTDTGLSGGESLVAAGWGATQLDSSNAAASPTLLMTQMSPVLDPIPSEPMHRLLVCSQLVVGFCAKGTDTNACAGDSGGPLVRSADTGKSATLIGIEGASNCANTADPSVNYAVYTDVSQVGDWIVQTMNDVEQAERASVANAIALQLLLSDD